MPTALASPLDWVSSCLHQGQFNFVEVVIKPLDYECNLVTLQCRKGEMNDTHMMPEMR